MTTPSKYSLSKKERLKSRTLINKLFEANDSNFNYPVKLLYRKEEFTQDNRWPLLFSVTVPKRQFKSAVDRNLIKRRIREAYRLHKVELQELLCKQNNKVIVTMFIYVGKEICSYQKIENAIKNQLIYLKNEVV